MEKLEYSGAYSDMGRGTFLPPDPFPSWLLPSFPLTSKFRLKKSPSGSCCVAGNIHLSTSVRLSLSCLQKQGAHLPCKAACWELPLTWFPPFLSLFPSPHRLLLKNLMLGTFSNPPELFEPSCVFRVACISLVLPCSATIPGAHAHACARSLCQNTLLDSLKGGVFFHA